MKILTTIILLFTALLCSRPANAQINGDPMPFVKPQFFDNGGKPAASYKLCTYAAGTNNPTRTYTTSALSVPNPNPLILDSAGRASIFWPNVAIKVILLTDKSTTTDCLTGSMITVWSVDNVQTAKSLIASLSGPGGSALIGFIQPQTGAVAETVQSKLRQIINVMDFGAVADWNGSTGTDNCAAFSNAVNAVTSAGGILYFPAGHFRTSCKITVSKPSVTLEGAGSGDIDCTTAATCIVFDSGQIGVETGTASISFSLRNMTLFSRSTGVGVGQHGIKIRAGSSITDNVTVVGFGADGWHADTDNVDHGTITRSFFYANYGDGWHCDSGDCNSMIVQGNRFYNNVGIGHNWVDGTNILSSTNDATANTGGDYVFGGASGNSINNYCEGGGTATMVVNGDYLILEQPVTGGCTVSGTGVGKVKIGQSIVEIDSGVKIGGAGGASSINLDAAAGTSDLRINVNGKSHATVGVYNGAGGGPNIVLNENGVSTFANGVGTGGGTIIYRCVTPGASEAGTLTSASGNCGTFVDSGLRTK